jgi:hypothetical protein
MRMLEEAALTLRPRPQTHRAKQRLGGDPADRRRRVEQQRDRVIGLAWSSIETPSQRFFIGQPTPPGAAREMLLPTMAPNSSE